MRASTAGPSGRAGAPVSGRPGLAVVLPAHNEAEALPPLIGELGAALAGEGDFEIVCVDDGSTDGTWAALAELAAREPRLQALRHARRSGQSAALSTGIRAARADTIATLDADGQYDPADVPKLIQIFRDSEKPGAGPLLVTGERRFRRDGVAKRLGSSFANRIRGRVLGDSTPDAGCGLKVFARSTFLDLPGFDHMHRFLPALVIRAGGRVVSTPVNHRPRFRGVSRYGILDRLWIGIVDLGGVAWLMRRRLAPSVESTVGKPGVETHDRS